MLRRRAEEHNGASFKTVPLYTEWGLEGVGLGITAHDRSGSTGNPLVRAESLSSTERRLILDELERIVSHGAFKNSKRCVGLLRYIVENTLAGQAGSMKERRLGIEVFGRPADYDNNVDPIVRTTATEIRKRLAQCYQEGVDPSQPCIRLSPGSYAPCFELPRGSFAPAHHERDHVLPVDTKGEVNTSPLTATDSEPLPALGLVEETAPARHSHGELKQDLFRTRNRRLAWVAGAVFVVLLAACASLFFFARANSDAALNRFWSPVFNSPAPVLVCVGAMNITGKLDTRAGFTQEMADILNGKIEPPAPTSQSMWPMVMFADAEKMSRVSEVLATHNKKFLIRTSDAVTLEDLRTGPAVLVGIFANTWTLRLETKLRFHPRLDYATQKMWIEDAKRPENHDWSVPWGEPFSQSYSDYAIVTRCRDSLSGQDVIAIGGLGLHGTQAAGDFVTSAKDLSQLSKGLSSPTKNVQIVLKIAVVNGNAGPPQIVAVNYW